MPRKLSIIVPAYNEEKTIGIILSKLQKLEFKAWKKEIIVVNDGSTDKTLQEIKSRKENLILINSLKNLGKGATIREGIKKSSGQAVIIQDADLEYNPENIINLLALLDKNTLVLGTRNVKPKQRGYLIFVVGQALLTKLVNLLFGSHLTDVYTCYKLLPSEFYRKNKLTSSGFEIEMEIICKALISGYKIVEVPVDYFPRKISEGKKIGFIDWLKGLNALISLKLSSWKFLYNKVLLL